MFDGFCRRRSTITAIGVLVVVASHEMPESGPRKKQLHRMIAAITWNGLSRHGIAPGISGAAFLPKTTIGISSWWASLVRFELGQCRPLLLPWHAVTNPPLDNPC